MAAPVTQDYSFGNRTAASVYEELSVSRSGVLEKARELAKISIPTLSPPEGYRPGINLPPPNQSINSQMINNLASRIMFTALPPGKPILKYNIIEHKIQPEIDQDPTMYSMTLLALSRVEVANRQRLEATNVRTAYVQMASQLLGAGNVLWKHMEIDWPSVHKMDTYVVKRNPTGQQLFNILKTKVNLGDLDAGTRTFIENVRAYTKPATGDTVGNEFITEVEVYCCCKLHTVSAKKKVWLYWEEYEGETIPDTDAMTDYDAPIQFAAWLVPQYGHNWGLSYCELYEGDMYTVENGEGSLNDMAEAAAMTLLFVKPGSTTSLKAIQKSRNLKWNHGNAEDITAFRLEKGEDANFVQAHNQAATKRLGQAFLSVSSIQRDAERVTAEEWRMMASELDQAMGGLYSEMAQGIGRTIILRFLALQKEEDPSIPPLPKDIIRVAVVTGIDALGLSDEEADLENALEVLSKYLGQQGLTQMLQGTNIIRRVFAGNGVKADDLVVNEQQQGQNTATAQQAEAKLTMLKGASGPVAKEAAGAISQAVTPGMVKSMQAPNGGQQPQTATPPQQG